MEQQAMKQHGAFSWNELMTTDVAAARAFYGELLGWEMRDEPTPNEPYTLLKAGNRDVGGMMAADDTQGALPAWMAYVTVDDVDKQVTRAEQLGGKLISPPRDIPDVGRFAVISDPQGAKLALITYTCQG